MVYWPQEDSLKRNILGGEDIPLNLVSLYHKNVLGNETFLLWTKYVEVSALSAHGNIEHLGERSLYVP